MSPWDEICGILREHGIQPNAPERTRIRLALGHERRDTLLRTAADLRAHCLQHNDKAPLGFAFCPCETASELERMAGPAVQG